MKEISAGVHKANKILDKAKKAATKYESRNFGDDLIRTAKDCAREFNGIYRNWLRD